MNFQISLFIILYYIIMEKAMIQKILFIMLITSFAQAQKKDHRVGNGGAGVTHDGPCREAGVRTSGRVA